MSGWAAGRRLLNRMESKSSSVQVPPEHIGLGVTVEGYDAIETDMTEEEVKSILKTSGKVGTVDESRKFVTYNKNWSGTKYIQVVYRAGYKAWVVEDKSRFGF